MKIKLISLFSLALMFVVTACDEYLDVMPDSRTELDSDEKITKLLANAYPDNTFIFTTEMASDNTDWKENDYSSVNNVQDQQFAWEDATENTGSDSPEDFWEGSYNAIATANHVLRAIEELGNPERLDAQRGEALLARAYNHFYLVNVFAKHYSEQTSETDLGIPYADQPETTVNPFYERQSVAETYRRIEKDLEEGLPLIDDNLYAVPKYHFNRKAAYAFAARFYLFTRKYDKVISAANEVLGEKPTIMIRNMKEFQSLTSDFQLRARHYVKTQHNANLLILTTYNYTYAFGNYNTGKKYAHTKTIASNETTQSAGPWGIYTGTLYYLPPSSYTQYIASPKIPYYFETTDPIAATGYRHSISVAFSADETLLCRAEAYIMKEDYANATNDLALWVTSRTTTGVSLTRTLVNEYYSNPELNYYIPADPTVKKQLHPEFPIVSQEQENFLQCLLHIRRIETIHEGLRWFDVKRFGIVIYRRYLDVNESVTVLDSLPVNDPRRAIQIPATVIKAGLAPNPR
ncbi:MAG: RagB/SusD family nutrient uptake outer membrane protein [Dysgonamonadaceae bacterium]|jgi:hypothetical protein|nr:RagB/SusD family nutrient uptake outer membrane protein [Dysgonamonadaceae bacterium]